MPAITIRLNRKNTKRVGNDVLRRQLTNIARRVGSGERSKWSAKIGQISEPQESDGLWETSAKLRLVRGGRTVSVERLEQEKQKIGSVLQQACTSSSLGGYPWEVKEISTDWAAPATPVNVPPKNEADFNVNSVVNFDRALRLDEITIPSVLVEGTDDEIENYPAFQCVFGRSAHIRIMASSIRTMIATNGMRRNHTLLWGLPGCAKSTLFRCFQKVLPLGSFLNINANSATKAGIEAIFLKRLHETGTPPFLFIEEIEKTLEAILTVWLSIMDDRAEVRKITFTTADQVETRVLCFATANDKELFDRLMGGRPGYPGAISSRFSKSLCVPRPTSSEMRRILLRDIAMYGGKPEWSDKCIELAEHLQVTDPRTVLSFLDGGDRLLTGDYQKDIITVHKQGLGVAS